MNPYNEVIIKMGAIEKSAPLESEHEADARYQWPTRWQLLKDFLKAASEPAVKSDAVICPKCGDPDCIGCDTDLKPYPT